MQLFRGLHNLDFISKGGVVTIGNYDGVHLGHQQILNFVVNRSKILGLPSIAVIFEPQPEEFFAHKIIPRLTNLREKLYLLERQGIDFVLLITFNNYFSTVSALDFVQNILLAKLKVVELVMGDDFVFGYGRTGNYSFLQEIATKANFEVIQLPAFEIDGERVSSSLIRQALLKDDLNGAIKYLGRTYQANGRVVHGDHLGRNLGFPTANIYLKKQFLPLSGVYSVKVYGLGPGYLYGLANIGFRPTVSGKNKLFEVYILNFNQDIYGKRIFVEFYRKLRNEKTFDSVNELREQIRLDVEGVKSRLEMMKFGLKLDPYNL